MALRRADYGDDDIAIQEQLNGKSVDWMEKVSEEQNQGRWGLVAMQPKTQIRAPSPIVRPSPRATDF